MKTHSSDYKKEIKEFGRQISSKIIYGNVELGEEDLNSITPSFESSILKSAMKRLEIDSNVEIPIGTEINFQFGCYVEDEYEYIDFGNYIVYSVEKQEDTNSYYIVAYDKMLYSMVDYQDMNITYPITIRNYLNAIATYLGLTFANASDTFANYDKEIDHELYLNANGDSIGYTFRDVLDELAQVTASTICINDDDELEIRYINDTNDTINEEYLNEVNVTFGEKFGPINSIVLSRAESDKVYLKDDASISQNGLCEICINDNQIMNNDDRNTYLIDILDVLDGLEYYINDYSSTGITYYDVCDRYNVSIGENTYSCIMFNDEINITQGLQEFVHTDRLEESETDYKKADKEDRKINQTRIEVDKHNQQISTLITYVGDRSEKTTSLTQDVDGLISQVQNIPTIIVEQSGYGSVTLENLANTKLGMIKVHPTNNVDIIRNVVSEHLVVRVGNKVGHRGIKFTQEEVLELKLPTNLYIYDANTYDEFVLDGSEEKMYVIHRVGWNNDTKYALQTPTIEEFSYQDFMIGEGNCVVSYADYPTAYIYVKAMIKNEFTNSFATKLDLNSTIEQTANAIGLNVTEFKDGEQVSGATILAQINNDESEVQINADKINLNGVVSANNSFQIDTDGNMSCSNATITGGSINLPSEEDEPTIAMYRGNLDYGNYRMSDMSSDYLHILSDGELDQLGIINFKRRMLLSSTSMSFYDEDAITEDNPQGWVLYLSKYGTNLNTDLYIGGNLSVTGSKNRIVKLDDGEYVKLNAYETTIPYFADIGEGVTNEDGECIINIDSEFAQTIEKNTYKVFVQELGEGKLYVEKHDDYFNVKGTPNLEFDYEIKAIQKGYANTRLEKYERSDK